MPDIILVNTLEQGLEVAHDRYPGAWHVFDMEGLLTPFLGNDTNREGFRLMEQPKYQSIQQAVCADSIRHPGTKRGLATNNTNQNLNAEVAGYASALMHSFGSQGVHLEPAHKGMQVANGILQGKPAGDQMRHISSLLALDVNLGVLLDDQWLKNYGEVANSGGLAIIAPRPVGEIDTEGRVIEHSGVMRSREYEEMVLRSLARKGPVARFAFRAIANSSISTIGEVINLRTAA